jgi:peptide/nickel transport system permease protein
MTTFLIRRIVQIFIVVILSAMVAYTLLNVAPGGPIDQLLAERQNSGPNAIREEDIVRIKERFELDLYLPVRFSRWLIGHPRGPLTIGGQTFWADLQVGCAIPGQVVIRDAQTGQIIDTVEEGCQRAVLLADLEGRRTSNGILFGDFGLSQQISRDQPISDLIMSRLPYTLWLMGVSILLAILIAIPIGVYSAVHQYSRFDYTMTTVTFIGISLPSFVFGIFMILGFSVLAQRAGWFYLPPGNAVGNRDYIIPLLGEVEAGSLLDRFLRFVMPCAVLTFINIAQWSRFVRASMLEVLGLDYVRTARAKGVRENVVILKHALRNSLIPFITLLAGVLATIFGGAVITETVFNWPGLGRLLLDAIGRNDYNVAMALLFISTVLLLVGYLISDIFYTIVDPRIRVS